LEKYGIEKVVTASNGIEAFEIIDLEKLNNLIRAISRREIRQKSRGSMPRRLLLGPFLEEKSGKSRGARCPGDFY